MSAYTFGESPYSLYYGLGTAANRKVASEPQHGSGDEVEVTVHGKVSYLNGYSVGDQSNGVPLWLENRTVTNIRVLRKAPPMWKAGDIAMVAFTPVGREYPYVRGAKDWPGDQIRKTDEEINALWEKGLVRHIQRDGRPLNASSQPKAA